MQEKFLFFILAFLILKIDLIDTKTKNEILRGSSNNNKNLKSPARGQGKPFPKPQSYLTTDTVHYLDERAFSFQYVQGSVVCDLLSSAFNRYYKIIFQHFSNKPNRNKNQNVKDSLLKRVVVNVHQPCENYPSLDSDESC